MGAPFKTTTPADNDMTVLIATHKYYLTDSLLGGDVVLVTVALNGPVTPVLVTAAT